MHLMLIAFRNPEFPVLIWKSMSYLVIYFVLMENGDVEMNGLIVMRIGCNAWKGSLGEHRGSENCRSAHKWEEWRRIRKMLQKEGIFCIQRVRQQPVRSSAQKPARADQATAWCKASQKPCPLERGSACLSELASVWWGTGWRLCSLERASARLSEQVSRIVRSIGRLPARANLSSAPDFDEVQKNEFLREWKTRICRGLLTWYCAFEIWNVLALEAPICV